MWGLPLSSIWIFTRSIRVGPFSFDGKVIVSPLPPWEGSFKDTEALEPVGDTTLPSVFPRSDLGVNIGVLLLSSLSTRGVPKIKPASKTQAAMSGHAAV